MSWECFNQTLNNYVPHKNKTKINININPKDFLWKAKQVSPCQSLASSSIEYCDMENKILGFQFEPVCTKITCLNYSVGSHQDETEIQYDRLSTQEWCNCENCEVMQTSLECVCSHKILEVKVFHFKCKARVSWNAAVLEFYAVEFNCEGNYFLEEFFSEISWKSFLSLSLSIFKMTPFQVFYSYFVFL